MSKSNPFKWHHYEASIILCCVRWYCTYPLSYRQVAEIVNERGMEVNHTTVLILLAKYYLTLEKLYLCLISHQASKMDENYCFMRLHYSVWHCNASVVNEFKSKFL
jgi:transposase-like protein